MPVGEPDADRDGAGPSPGADPRRSALRAGAPNPQMLPAGAAPIGLLYVPLLAGSSASWPAARTHFGLQRSAEVADGLRMEIRLIHRIGSAVLFVALALVLATASSASSPEAGDRGNYRGQCRRLTKQINHYEYQILPMAIERGNRTWEKATNEQVERLWHRRADLCPAYGKERTMMAKAADRARKFNKLLATAARAAATYFSGGLMP